MSPPPSPSGKILQLCPYYDSMDRALVARIRRRGAMGQLECILYCAVRSEKEKQRRRPRPDQVVSL